MLYTGIGHYDTALAVVSGGGAADRLSREAISYRGRTRNRAELPLVDLRYGEWLRRERRHGDAREQLGIAHDMLASP